MFILLQARQKDATAGEQRYGNVIATSLREMMAPYFLRRTKGEVSAKKRENGKEAPA